jgi:hypothetical protein
VLVTFLKGFIALSNAADEFLKLWFPKLSTVIDETSFLPKDPPTYKDTSRASELFGYDPRYGYEELLSEILARKEQG